jgi:hypothetical protein
MTVDDAYGGYRGMWRDAEDELVKVRAENERLREAMLTWALGEYDWRPGDPLPDRELWTHEQAIFDALTPREDSER